MQIDHDAEEPPYRQLYRQLRAGIEDGTYPPGRAIPSVSRIQQETGMAIMTIRKAFRLLADEGFVRITPSRGTYVISRGAAPGPSGT